MKKLIVVIILFSGLMFSQTLHAANCGSEKVEEFDGLAMQLLRLDGDLAKEAKEAYRMASVFDAFEKDESKRCAHVDTVLQDMRDMIETLKN